jgi:hypothetical protein
LAVGWISRSDLNSITGVSSPSGGAAMRNEKQLTAFIAHKVEDFFLLVRGLDETFS